MEAHQLLAHARAIQNAIAAQIEMEGMKAANEAVGDHMAKPYNDDHFKQIIIDYDIGHNSSISEQFYPQ